MAVVSNDEFPPVPAVLDPVEFGRGGTRCAISEGKRGDGFRERGMPLKFGMGWIAKWVINIGNSMKGYRQLAGFRVLSLSFFSSQTIVLVGPCPKLHITSSSKPPGGALWFLIDFSSPPQILTH